MQFETPAYDQPCCPSRLAIRGLQLMALAVACVLLWPTPASCQPSPVPSEIQLTGPACCLQQQHAGELRTLGELPAVELQSILQVAAEWTDTFNQIKQALAQHESTGVQLTSDAEEIAAGEAEENPCFVSEPLSDVGVNISLPEGQLPEDLAAVCRAQNSPISDARLHGGWAMYDKHWAATCMHHRPLYFEEVNAERYGYTPSRCMQPFISAGRFLVTIPALPYLMVARPQCRPIYTLGHYRPGDCVPYRWHLPPCDFKAGFFEAAVIVGLVALIP